MRTELTQEATLFLGGGGPTRRRSRARGDARARPAGHPAFEKVRPFLAIALALVVAAAVTLVLLQSAGAIDLRILGATGSM